VRDLPLQLSQKERMLLQDQLSHEEICIQKYTAYTQQAGDPQLKQMFNTYAQQERNHYNTINQILQGQVPNMQQGQQQGGQGQQMQQAGPPAQFGLPQGKKGDEALCNDMLMTEKYVSGTYDTAIFEFQDTNVRAALNHIQKEEQGHGEGIFNYMKEKGWYQPQ
jgi:spore coat protein CotF